MEILDLTGPIEESEGFWHAEAVIRLFPQETDP